MKREEYLNKFLEAEFPSFVRKYFDEFSTLYPERYKSIATIEDGKGNLNLFEYIEKWFEKEYEIPFRINNHFEFHSDYVFFVPTKNFGFETEIGSFEELYSLEPNYRKISNIITPCSIYSYSFSKKSISSKIVSEKLNADLDLECKYYELNLRSFFKRFFIQGGVDLLWITIDQLKFYGIDKFPHALDKELERIEYSSEFDLKYGHLGTMYDEYGIIVSDQDEIRKKEHEYYKRLKEKGYKNLNYIDILSQPSYLKSVNNSDGDYIFSNCNQVGRVPILKLNHHFIKREKNPEYQSKLLKLREKASSYFHKFDYKTPFFHFIIFPLV
jgi:hypothetical protein